MKTKRIGPLSLAIVLIALGVLVLLSNILDFNLLEHFNLIFSIILITLGLEIILTRMKGKDKEEESPMIDGKSIFIIILIFILTFVFLSLNLLITNVGGINWNNINLNIPGVINKAGYNYTYEREYVIEKDVESKNKLSLYNPHGSVEINPGEGNSVIVYANIKIRNDSESEAERISKKVIDINELSNEIVIKSLTRNYINNNLDKISIDYRIRVPDSFELDIENGFGKVEVSNINNNIKIKNQHDNVVIKDINGDVDVNSKFDDLNIENINGSFTAKDEHGDVYIKNVSKSININNRHGKINARDIKGSAKLSTTHDDIKVENISKDIDVDIQYGDLDIIRCEGEVDVVSKHCNIDVDANEVQLKNIYINNQYGDVDLNVPDINNVNWKLYTKYGNISSEFDIDEDDHGNTESASVNNDSDYTVDISNEHGDIVIL